jgi:membrane fusion protein, multidrug efflux system
MRRSLSFLAFAVLAVSFSGCNKGAGGPGGGFKMPPLPVEVADVTPQPMREQFRALGGIEAQETIEVTSEVSGRVLEMPFHEGSWVPEGALLARFDDREAKAAADRADAQHEQAKSNARRAETLASEQVISQAELDDVRSALRVAKANDDQAATQYDKTHIRAPWGGLVGMRRVSPGAYVKPGDVITEIARVNEVKVRFSAPERYASSLHVGVPAEITTPAFPGAIFAGRLRVVDPIVDAQTRTIQLEARVPNPGRRLKPGMSANVAVTLAEHHGALVVPDEAVFAEGAQSFVFVVKSDSTVARVPVVLGLRDSSRVEVVRGLDAGQRVVSAGHQKIFEGAKVMPIPAGMMGGGPGGPGGPGGGAPGGKPAVADSGASATKMDAKPAAPAKATAKGRSGKP